MCTLPYFQPAKSAKSSLTDFAPSSDRFLMAHYVTSMTKARLQHHATLGQRDAADRKFRFCEFGHRAARPRTEKTLSPIFCISTPADAVPQGLLKVEHLRAFLSFFNCIQ
jgi:hypothetical protein